MDWSMAYYRVFQNLAPPLQPKPSGAGHGWSCFLVIYLNKRKFVEFGVVKRSLADFIALLVKDPLTQTDKNFAIVHTNYVVKQLLEIKHVVVLSSLFPSKPSSTQHQHTQ